MNSKPIGAVHGWLLRMRYGISDAAAEDRRLRRRRVRAILTAICIVLLCAMRLYTGDIRGIAGIVTWLVLTCLFLLAPIMQLRITNKRLKERQQAKGDTLEP